MNLPTNREAELCVLGCCLDGGIDYALQAVEALPGEAFFHDDTRVAFGILEGMATAGKEISSVTLDWTWRQQRKGSSGAPKAILESVSLIPSKEQLPVYVQELLESLKRRKVIDLAARLSAKAQNQNLDLHAVIAECEALLRFEGAKQLPTYNGKQCAIKLLDDLERRFQLNGKKSGLVTGFHKLDDITDGLQAGEQAILGARPSIGKSALAGNIVKRVALLDRIPTLLVTLEMSTEAITRRILSDVAGIPLGILKRGQFSEEEHGRFKDFQLVLKDCPLVVVEAVGGIDINQLSAIVRRHCRTIGVQLVVVDYLQRIRPTTKHEKRTYEVGEVSGMLKALAVETNSALLTVAQVNRESDKDKGRLPRLSDLADSGQIERDADLVLLLHRKLVAGESEQAKLIIAKQRDGETGMINLGFEGQFCRFSEQQ